MSQSTLKDYYGGMKMTTFDGSNIYQQIRKMNEDPVGAPPSQSRGGATNGGFNQSFGK